MLRNLIFFILVVSITTACKFTNPVIPSSFYNKTSGSVTLSVIDANTTLGTLSQYCDVANFTSTYYSDSTLGIGWGTNSAPNGGANPYPAEMQCCTITNAGHIKHVRTRIISTIDPIELNTGYLYITRPIENVSSFGQFYSGMEAQGYLTFWDGWIHDYWGYNFLRNHVSHTTLIPSTSNTAHDVVIDEDYETDQLQICMGTDETGAVYNQRYIKELSITVGK